jgi:DNA-binding transcriptional LysR family regulator
MSQPPLSQQIHVLEQLIGVRLFERSRHGAQLTREGAAILGPIRRFMEHAHRLEVAVPDARQGRSDVVAVAAINSALFDVMPRLMRIVKQRYPHLSLSMSEMKSVDSLTADGRAERRDRHRLRRAARSCLGARGPADRAWCPRTID